MVDIAVFVPYRDVGLVCEPHVECVNGDVVFEFQTFSKY
jgi:hypothetical protein